ncbi:hypothetical protein [Companilactobacillus jidongensis]|uniref:hypothetical protein n=1 Tax=Companilactobacillus jidongensis TaxID=2486006 RepID=UPI000F7669AE|nr:hypothetical protein [Companilactobacillus jidongensis]
MADNALTKVARIASKAAQGATYKDAKGNIQIIKPAGDSNYMDFTNFLTSTNGTGGSTGGNTDQNHPAAGADYYAGSLADGEITERYLLYQRDESVAEQTGSQTVILLRDVGTKFNMAGDGATFLIHLQRTSMAKGAKGAVTDIELNYDTNNVAKEGYFTTTSVYPVYIKSTDLATTNELDIPINGIGENLSGKNFLAPHLHVKFNGDGTMTYSSVTGYDNDGNTAGATGANYDVIVDVIATFSTQKAVAQFPESIKLFSGSTRTDKANILTLDGTSDYYENVSDGLLINLTKYAYTLYDNQEHGYRISNDDIGILANYVIPKEKLIVGNKIPFQSHNTITDNKTVPVESYVSGTWKSDGTAALHVPSQAYVLIEKNKITVQFVFQINFSSNYHNAFLDIQSITPYRK